MTISIQKILLPTDFSTLSAIATKCACELAEIRARPGHMEIIHASQETHPADEELVVIK